MENSFHGLPPLKRFKLLQQTEEKTQDSPNSCFLPAKKRIELRNSPVSYCLPAKKRVFAPQTPFGMIEEVEEEDSLAKKIPKFLIQPYDSKTGKEEAKQEDENEDLPIEDDDEDGIICCICNSTDGDPSDPIVFCDGCDLMVHASCYGNPLIQAIPEGDWFCSSCSFTQKIDLNVDLESVNCCLCPIKGGATKPTVDGRWAHIMCALLVPEVFFNDSEGREGIDCSRVPTRRWKDVCYVCKTANGCAIECSQPKCFSSFHVTCGLKEDLCIEYKEVRGGAIVAGFCDVHTQLWKKQQKTGRFKIVAREKRGDGRTKG